MRTQQHTACTRDQLPLLSLHIVPQVKALLHAADISNHVRPFPVALSHAERIQQEFRRQVARERALGLPVSPHMDAPEQTWYKMEVQFIDYVAGPLWERLAQASGGAEGSV